ncbi:MAG TPA: hypothetical protein VF982_09995 [Anaerolineales bacterium]
MSFKDLDLTKIAPLIFPAPVAKRLAQEAVEFETVTLNICALTGRTEAEVKAVIDAMPGKPKLIAAKQVYLLAQNAIFSGKPHEDWLKLV